MTETNWTENSERNLLRHKVKSLESECAALRLENDGYRQDHISAADLKIADARHQENHLGLRLILESSPFGVSIVSRNNPDKRLFANKRMVEMFGFESSEDILHFSASESYVNPEDLENLRRSSKEGNFQTEVVMERYRKDGTRWWCDFFRRQARFEGEDVIISWHADITDRKHAELAVSENISILQAIFDNTPLNMNLKDTTGRYQLINNIYADWYGLTPEDIIGKRASEFAFDAPIAADMSNNEQTVLETGKPNQYEVQIRGKDGSLYDRQVIKFPVKTRDGKINSIGTIAIDITQHKQIERKLLEAKESAETANNAKSEFLSSVSHELRTPLNAILGSSQMLERGHRQPLGEFQKKCVDHIVAGGNHFLGLINKSAIDRRLTISDDLTATQTVNADYTRFKQVLLNLLSNAVKYNREGGTVTLTTKDVSNNAIRILVVDTGAGIADEDQIGLFEPFNRLGQEAGEIEGTGIGLTITKQLVEAMGGEIGYDTEVGKGSTFWIKFPAIERTLANRMEPVEVSKTDADQNQSNMAAETLYIEDNPANLQLMEAVIEEMDGLTLISAHNAELGMTMASEQQPNLILMDINLPGIDGDAAMHALSANDATKDIPVIAISAAAMKSDVVRSMSAGFKDYLTKPFNVPELVKSIKKELDG